MPPPKNRIGRYETIAPMQNLQSTGAPAETLSGDFPLQRNERGWLLPVDDFLRTFLARPELAPVPESCRAELALHAALLATPAKPIAPGTLVTLQDADARESYTLFLRFRDGLLAAGTLEAYYLSLFRPASSAPAGIDIPPLFIDLVVQAITRNLLADSGDAFEVRAADLLHRSQRISIQDGQLLSGDRDTLDMLNETGGLGDIGRFLLDASAPLRSIDMQVLGDDNAADFFQQAGRHHFLLDLTHEVTNDLSHGLIFRMTRARSGLKALSTVLQKWVQHFLGVAVTIRPLQKIDDDAWRWHVGLDAEATRLLNDLYEGHEVDDARLKRLVSLFRLDFVNPQEMRADVAGKPVYLGLMMNADGIVRLKPQNLLINLPLRAAM
jgi:Family of unknown function (DUF6352)